MNLNDKWSVAQYIEDHESKLRDYFKADITHVRETFDAFWRPFRKDDKKLYFVLTSNITEYETFYNMMDLYDDGNITKYNWSLTFVDGKLKNFVSTMDKVL